MIVLLRPFFCLRKLFLKSAIEGDPLKSWDSSVASTLWANGFGLVVLLYTPACLPSFGFRSCPRIWLEALIIYSESCLLLGDTCIAFIFLRSTTLYFCINFKFSGSFTILPSKQSLILLISKFYIQLHIINELFNKVILFVIWFDSRSPWIASRLVFNY